MNGKGINISTQKSYIAAADLSSYQYHFVYLTADNTVNICGANGRAIGILMNKPNAAGKPAEVLSIGATAKLKINGAVTVGKMLTSTAAGKGEVVDAANEWVAALALQGGVLNDIIEVLVVGFNAVSTDA